MKKNSRKRSLVPWVLIVALCIMLTSCIGANAASKNSYYPGPTENPDKPVEVITPKPTAKPTPAPTPEPTPAPTQKPWTPKPTPEPEEEDEETPYYTLTVYYIYPDGSDAALPYVEQFRVGENFEVVSPWIPGHLVSMKKYSGTMPGRNHSFVVWYYKSNYIILEDYDTPLGLGNVVINIGDCYE